METQFGDGLIEKRSIDYIPIAERHGKVWHLWPVWFRVMRTWRPLLRASSESRWGAIWFG